VIAFDADDTLWVNETYFREAEQVFSKLLVKYAAEDKTDRALFKKEIENLKLYGYGVKGFVLSMFECALELSKYQVDQKILQEILDIGKEMLDKPVELLVDIEAVLKSLSGNYKLIVATKGDLLDQERKLEKSNLLKYFHHVAVMSDKKTKDYQKLIRHLDIHPSELLMIGNSLKSDVLPLIEIGAAAIHVPFHTTWIHEEVPENKQSKTAYKTVLNIKEVLALF
jgi:putative hydrolase of the HAD superfamily